MANKQVMDIRSEAEGISQGESDEQQRNWNEKQWQQKAKDSLANYDPTRAHLNFEVTKGGSVQSIDKSKNMQQKFEENIALRGIKNPNAREHVKRKQRTLAKFILGGSSEKMLKLAFGEQQVDFTKGADNSGLQRSKDIENWAVDSYKFLAKKFGEENIVSFYVHLDEKNPHVHCTVIPVDQKTNRISWKAAFNGDTIDGCSSIFLKLHNEYAEEVSKKYGLERGDNVEETKAKHRSTEEYKRDLVHEVGELEGKKKTLEQEIQACERKIKAFTTMINNLQQNKENIEAEIGLLKKQFGDGEISNEELAEKLEKLNRKMENIDEKIASREKQLEDTRLELEKLQNKLEEAKENLQNTEDKVEFAENKHQILSAENEELAQKLSFKYKAFISLGLQQELLIAIEKLMPTFDSQQEDIFKNSFIGENLNNLPNVTKCAMYLMAGYVDLAMQMGGSSGGGGGNNQGWRKKDDEDEAHWARRCMHGAAKILNPIRRNIGRKK